MIDTAVVGAGPAGSVTAYCLARNGYSVHLLDKEEFPRHKPCGGGLPVHAVDLLEDIGISIDPIVEEVTERVKFLYDSKDPVESDLSDAPVTMVSRGRFDTFLAEEAEKQGAVFEDGTGVQDINIKDGYCELILPDRTQKAKFVVGADGANSRVGRSVGLMQDQDCGVAIDAEIEVDPSVYRREKSYSTFNVNYVEDGYGWVFPKDGYLSMGVGGYPKDVAYPKALDQFLEENIGTDRIRSKNTYGHPLPFYQGCDDVVNRRVALVGDAAGMVDALSGEGIFYAMQGASILADSIDRALSEDIDYLNQYSQRLKKTVFKELRWSGRLANVFFKFPRKCYEHGVKRPEVVNWIKRVVVSESSYDEIYEKIWSEIKNRLSGKVLSTLGLG